mgnify:CR=1 FL=1
MLNYISAVGIQPKISRCVGMADDADSKSVGCTPVRVQVPPPALSHGLGISGLLSKINDFKAFLYKA